MASIDKRQRSNGTPYYVARYRDPARQQKSRNFDRKIDAENFLTSIESDKLEGSYIDPGAGRVTVGEWSQRWLDGQVHLKPSSYERDAGIVRKHIVPRWGSVGLGDINHPDVQAWVNKLSRSMSPATVRRVHGVLSRILNLAVKARRLPANYAAGVNLPRFDVSEHRYLTHEQVDDLADACGAYRLVVLFLAYTGVRFGELAGLRVRRLDLMRRRAAIAETVVYVNGRATWGTPKNHERRSVPIPAFLVDELAEQVAGKDGDDLVFNGARGGSLRAQGLQRAALTDAAEQIGVPGFHPHELRHTAASLAIASGADVKVVQQMLGHKTATMTIDLYGHLFPDRLDEVADALDAARLSSRSRRATTGRQSPSVA